MKASERGGLFGRPVSVGVPQRYTDGTAVIIATGPSLTREQVDKFAPLKRRNRIVVIGVNDAYRICPWLDYLYAADFNWIAHHDAQVPKRLRGGFLFTTRDERTNQFASWRQVESKAAQGLSLDRNLLHRGNNSGYQAINLAYLLGIRRILLLGYDHHSGGHHFFGKHPTPAMDIESNYSNWVPGYRTIRDQDIDLTIVNCTPGSAIDAFPKLDIDAAIDCLELKT